ncbi:MAG: hypothetical protein KKF33_09700 [Alphaproteobacteria bacterium]|nr:hypothetical protein [Alphaproteobacteria bacterium]
MQISPISRVDITLVPGSWPLPAPIRADVPAFWAEAMAANPHLWDGRVLGLSPVGDGPIIDAQGVLRAEAREDGYSSLMTWRRHGFPDFGLRHAFGCALIVSSDGALIYGVMGGDTANAGRVYPPGGSLEPRDVRPDGSIDVLNCIALELDEETGLNVAEARHGQLYAVEQGTLISLIKVLHFAETAEALVARIRINLDAQAHRELADVVVIRSHADAIRLGAVPYAQAVAAAFESGSLS